MLLLFFLAWVIFNGRFTLEIALFGLAVSGLVFGFLCKFMDYSLEKERTFYKKLPIFCKYVWLLLKEVGKLNKPVLLKRGLCATMKEWLMSAEYVMSEGNERVILCERGIRTYETATRNTLDLSCVPILHELTHLPVVVDPSHATGKAKLVSPMAVAATAAGADGLMIEVHNDPAHAWCDGPQSLTPEQFAALAQKVGTIREAMA